MPASRCAAAAPTTATAPPASASPAAIWARTTAICPRNSANRAASRSTSATTNCATIRPTAISHRILAWARTTCPCPIPGRPQYSRTSTPTPRSRWFLRRPTRGYSTRISSVTTPCIASTTRQMQPMRYQVAFRHRTRRPQHSWQRCRQSARPTGRCSTATISTPRAKSWTPASASPSIPSGTSRPTPVTRPATAHSCGQPCREIPAAT